MFANFAGAGRESARFLKLIRVGVLGRFKFCGSGAGLEKKFQTAQDSAMHANQVNSPSLYIQNNQGYHRWWGYRPVVGQI